MEVEAQQQQQQDQQQQMLKEQAISGSTGMQLRGSELPVEADLLLLWLARFPVEYNHPRFTTGNIRLRKSGDVVVVDSTEKIPTVFRKFINENFLSAPVVDANRRYLGFIDMLDLVYHTLNSFRLWMDTNAAGQAPNLSYWTRYWELADFQRTSVAQVMQSAWVTWKPRSVFHPVYLGFSLLYAMEMMANSGAHRIPILDADDKVTGILTQSMIISLLNQELDRFGRLKDIPIPDFFVSSNLSVLCVETTAVAKDAFEKMVLNNVTGLAVVDKAGVLVDTISIRDLRGIGANGNHFDILYKTIAEFKEECKKLFPGQTPQKPIFVTPNDNFARLIRCMDDGNIHRVFVCEMNANNQPIPTHVITQRAVIKFILRHIGLPQSPIASI